MDGAKAGVLEDPIEGGVKIGGEVANVAEAVGFGGDRVNSPGAVDGGSRDIEAGDPCSLSSEEAGIFPDATAGNEDVPVDGISAQPGAQRGSGGSFFPRGIALPIAIFPVYGILMGHADKICGDSVGDATGYAFRAAGFYRGGFFRRGELTLLRCGLMVFPYERKSQ